MAEASNTGKKFNVTCSVTRGTDLVFAGYLDFGEVSRATTISALTTSLWEMRRRIAVATLDRTSLI